ncbi:cytotoxin/hemolysin TlyA [Mycobacteroides abscessus subsp. massiliense]|nr:cytotoxin/hemolysin TlyA [Mycobacteroides abscessus subsp. massiliense]
MRDPRLRADAVVSVARRARSQGWFTAGVTASPLPGPSGNVEYFLWLRRTDSDVDVEAAVAEAVSRGPQ